MVTSRAGPSEAPASAGPEPFYFTKFLVDFRRTGTRARMAHPKGRKVHQFPGPPDV